MKDLTLDQEIKFLEMILDVKSPVYFKDEFDFNLLEIDKYKKKLNIENENDAAKLLRQKIKSKERPNIDNEIVKEKERVANAKIVTKPLRIKIGVDKDKIKTEDSKRQKRLEKQEQKNLTSSWRLPEEHSVELFEHDIVEHGRQFCMSKYDVESFSDIIAEAERLKLKINWDLIRG